MNTQRRRFLLSAAAIAGTQLLPACAVRDANEAPVLTVLNAARFTQLRRFQALSMGTVAYVEQGSGHAVLLLHGFPLNSFQWRGVIERLSPHARCIAPDFLCMGHSTAAPGADVGPGAQADMLVALLDAIGVARSDVIANDSGCAVAQLLMVRHPSRVRSVLLTNGDTERQCPPPAMQPVIDLARRGRLVDEWFVPWYRDPALARSLQGIGGMCYANRAHPTDEALGMYFGPLLESAERKAAMHAYAVALEQNALAGIAPALRTSRVPTRIVWGTGDEIFDLQNADYLDRTLGRSLGVRRLPGMKLFWPEERPDLIAGQARILWEHASELTAT